MRVQTAVVAAGWAAWLGVIVLHGARQPRSRRVASRRAPGAIGFAMQTAAAVAPWLVREPPSAVRDAVAVALVPPAVLAGCLAVRALGKQWRLPPALIDGHELIREGPYGIVRHPVYLSFFAMTLAGAVAAAGWRTAALAAALFVAGTEIRVRAEDRLLAERFGEEFERYRARVPAYLPGIR